MNWTIYVAVHTDGGACYAFFALEDAEKWLKERRDARSWIILKTDMKSAEE